MRRLLAILLFLVTSLPLASPLFALGANDDANVPICCRRNGLHHCNYATLPGDAPRVSEPMHCPFSPKTVAPVRHSDTVADNGSVLFCRMQLQGSVSASAWSNSSAAPMMAHRQRGPPSFTS